MILNAYDYLMGDYIMGDKQVYTVHYRTWKQTKSKFRAFTTLYEAIKWAKRQRGKVIAEAGSWQVLWTLDGKDISALEA